MTSERQQAYLQAMGIDVWKLRRPLAPITEDLHLTKEMTEINTRESMIAQMGWDALESAVTQCQACALYKTRTRPVFGVGRRDANLLIVGEAPGANEDKQGEPFVGRGGQLLNAMLQAIDLNRQAIYIANILKSRPPNNRDPQVDEVAACTPFLLRQITLIQPKVILAVGRIAAQYLLNTQLPMARLRGQRFEYGPLKTPLLISYHPAYLLRSPGQKKKAWEDMQLLDSLLKSLASEAA